MPDIEHKLHYRGVNWNKVHRLQERRWAARSGDVVVVSAADPEKIKEFKKKRNAEGLNVVKKKKKRKKKKKNNVNKQPKAPIKYSSKGRKRSTGDENDGLPIVRKTNQ